jgi:hypothetical protein
MNTLLAAALACALAATPEPPPPPLIAIGVGAAVALPGGEVARGEEAADRLQRVFPLELRLGWRVAPEIEVGLSGAYGFSTVGSARADECSARGITCDAYLWRVAVRGEYAWRGAGRDLIPWGAALVGFEQQVERWKLDSSDFERTGWNGWLAGIEAGVDKAVFPGRFDLGLFAGFAFGQYVGRTVSGETAGYAHTDAVKVADPALHRWITVGLRGTLGI